MSSHLASIVTPLTGIPDDVVNYLIRPILDKSDWAEKMEKVHAEIRQAHAIDNEHFHYDYDGNRMVLHGIIRRMGGQTYDCFINHGGYTAYIPNDGWEDWIFPEFSEKQAKIAGDMYREIERKLFETRDDTLDE